MLAEADLVVFCSAASLQDVVRDRATRYPYASAAQRIFVNTVPGGWPVSAKSNLGGGAVAGLRRRLYVLFDRHLRRTSELPRIPASKRLPVFTHNVGVQKTLQSAPMRSH